MVTLFLFSPSCLFPLPVTIALLRGLGPTGTQVFPVPFLPQATDALYEVLMGNKLRAATFRLFPQLLMTLLIQIHHSIGLTMSDVIIPSGLYAEQEIPMEVTPLWYCSLSFH